MDYLSELLSFLGGVAAGWSLKIVVDRSSKSSSTQKHNKAGGDIAGRDINKKS